MPPFDDWRRPIWLQHVGNTSTLKVVRREGAGKIAARVHVGHIKIGCVIAKELPETERKKRLMSISESVGDVPKRAMRDPVVRDALPRDALLRDALKGVPYIPPHW